MNANDNSTQLPITYRGVVYPAECDHMGHMNVAFYTQKFDGATWNLFALLGVTPTYIREKQLGIAGVQQNITYKKEMAAGDLVTVRSRILDVRPKVIRCLHELLDGETSEVAASSELTVVHMDLRTRKSSPYPHEVQERARALIF